MCGVWHNLVGASAGSLVPVDSLSDVVKPEPMSLGTKRKQSDSNTHFVNL